jgi:hypothetical protein
MHAHTRFLWYGTLSSAYVRLGRRRQGERELAAPPVASRVAAAAVFWMRALAALTGAACNRHSAPVLDAAPAEAGPEAEGAVPVPEAPEAVTEPLVPASTMIPEPPPRVPGAVYPTFKKTTLPPDQLARMVEAAPELARLGGSIAMFEPGDNPYVRRSKADHEGITITPVPVLWSPSDGVQVLVVTGRGKEGSFVAAWWPLPDGQYRLASTFVMLGEVAPVALAFHPPDRALQWTTCWRCSGENGHLAPRPDGSIVILQD